MNMHQDHCADEAEGADSHAYIEKLSELPRRVVNYRGQIIVQCSDHFDLEEEQAESQGQLVVREPHAHDGLLCDRHAVAHAKYYPTQQAKAIAVVLEASYEHPLTQEA